MTKTTPTKAPTNKAAVKKALTKKTAQKTAQNPAKKAANKEARGIPSWAKLKALALSLKLPHVEEATSWGNPCLKAHGKLWSWWSPHCDAPVFKVSFEEREFLLEMEPEVFFLHPHYKNHPLVLAYPATLDPEWARANLSRVWREMAPKKVLKAYDEGKA
jgi:hypothetical protein